MYTTLQEVKPFLQIGDIVLMRNLTKAYSRKLIRDMSHSYWTHSAIIFDIIKDQDRIKSIILFEMNEGVELHRLETYEYAQHEYELGIIRLSTLGERERARIQSICMSFIDNEYNYGHVFGIFFFMILRRDFGFSALRWLMALSARSKSYICTTLIQRILYLAADQGNRRNMLFRQHEKGLSFSEKMGVINPRNISTAKNIEWLYNKHY